MIKTSIMVAVISFASAAHADSVAIPFDRLMSELRSTIGAAAVTTIETENDRAKVILDLPCSSFRIYEYTHNVAWGYKLLCDQETLRLEIEMVRSSKGSQIAAFKVQHSDRMGTEDTKGYTVDSSAFGTSGSPRVDRCSVVVSSVAEENATELCLNFNDQQALERILVRRLGNGDDARADMFYWFVADKRKELYLTDRAVVLRGQVVATPQVQL